MRFQKSVSIGMITTLLTQTLFPILSALVVAVGGFFASATSAEASTTITQTRAITDKSFTVTTASNSGNGYTKYICDETVINGEKNFTITVDPNENIDLTKFTSSDPSVTIVGTPTRSVDGKIITIRLKGKQATEFASGISIPTGMVYGFPYKTENVAGELIGNIKFIQDVIGNSSLSVRDTFNMKEQSTHFASFVVYWLETGCDETECSTYDSARGFYVKKDTEGNIVNQRRGWYLASYFSDASGTTQNPNLMYLSSITKPFANNTDYDYKSLPTNNSTSFSASQFKSTWNDFGGFEFNALLANKLSGTYGSYAYSFSNSFSTLLANKADKVWLDSNTNPKFAISASCISNAGIYASGITFPSGKKNDELNYNGYGVTSTVTASNPDKIRFGYEFSKKEMINFSIDDALTTTTLNRNQNMTALARDIYSKSVRNLVMGAYSLWYYKSQMIPQYDFTTTLSFPSTTTTCSLSLSDITLNPTTVNMNQSVTATSTITKSCNWSNTE